MTDLPVAGVAETARLVAGGELVRARRRRAGAVADRRARPASSTRSRGCWSTRPSRRPSPATRRWQPGRHSGPLHGVPIAIKEEIDVAGAVTTFGGDGNSTPAAADAEVVTRLRAAGAVVIGKTDDAGVRGVPLHRVGLAGDHPQPVGPQSRTPGGSSGGTAVAVASGMVPVGIGGDGGGSIRIPSASCGLFGLKPQRGPGHHGPAPAPVVRAGHGRSADPHGPRQRPRLRRDPRQRGRRPLHRRRDRLVRRGRGARARPAADRVVDQAGRARGEARPAPRAGGRGHRPAAGRRSATTCARSTRGTPTRPRRSCRSSSPASAPRRRWSSTTTGSSVGPARPAGSAPGSRRRSWSGRCDRPRGSREGQPGLRRRRRAAHPGDRAPARRRSVVLDGAGTIRPSLRSMPSIAYAALWNVAGNPAASVPCGIADDGLPLAVQLVGRTDDEADPVLAGRPARGRPGPGRWSPPDRLASAPPAASRRPRRSGCAARSG